MQSWGLLSRQAMNMEYFRSAFVLTASLMPTVLNRLKINIPL